MSDLQFRPFKTCSNSLDVRLEILVDVTCVNQNGMSVHVEHWTIDNRSVHGFGLTELNKTMGSVRAAGQIANNRHTLNQVFCHKQAFVYLHFTYTVH